ncbi:MAG TPA: alpha/beta hydrolase [Thermoanaerobaculia bacterium]|nr:alpha/beta hydrolase [Thermoanaerobaculia bacterium]
MLLKLIAVGNALALCAVGARRRRLPLGDGVSLAYSRLGRRDGEPWVLVHGLGSVGVTWAPVLRALRRDCRLIVPDLSALGGSKVPGDAFGIQDGARAVARLIEHELGGRPVTVAGLSLGGWMAVRLALARPELVARLVLIDAGGYRAQDWEKIQYLVTVHDLAGVERLYRALFVNVPWSFDRGRRGFLEAFTSPSVRAILETTREEDTFDDRDLGRIQVPAAVVWGEHDGIFPLATARAVAAALPRGSLRVLEGCGHGVHWECPRALVEAIQEFRRETAGRSADLSLAAAS